MSTFGRNEIEHNVVSEESYLAIEKALKEGVLTDATLTGGLRWNQVLKQNVGAEKRVKFRTNWHGEQIHLWLITKPSPEGKMLRSCFLSIMVGEDKRIIKDPAMKDLMKAVLDQVRDSDENPGRIIVPNPHKKHISFAGRKTAATEALAKGARRKGIGFTDIIVLDNKLRCENPEHSHTEVVISINLIGKHGREVLKQIPALYCEECKIFIIKYGVFRAYRAQGFIFPCQVMDYKTFIAHEFEDYNAMDMNKNSVFMRFGYIAAKEYGVTEQQRGKIIYNLLSRNVLSKDDMRLYLDTLIAADGYTPHEKAAWKKDRSLLG